MFSENPSVAFVTFGCRLNHAEVLAAECAYRAAGWNILDIHSRNGRGRPPNRPPTPRAPNRIIVRGCSVTAKAARDCEKALAHLRTRFPDSEIIRTGCLENATPAIPLPEPRRANEMPPVSSSRYFLKVQDGCSGACTFCIVPHFRGAPRSVPFAAVLAEARAALDAGFRELVVTGCNLALYADSGQRLPDLLAALADCAAPFAARVRLGSLEPGLLDAALLATFAAHPNICPFLHLSVQSGSNNVLARMHRPYTAEQIAAFADAARARLGPRLMLGADIITGFPGESDADFADTCSLLFPEHARRFTTAHIFPYSERPGTPAAQMTPVVPVAIRRARARQLEAQKARAFASFARSFIGCDVEVCVERSLRKGLTAEGIPCRLATPAPRRSLVPVQIASFNHQLLIGQPTNQLTH